MIYNTKTIASLKLRHALKQRLSRRELFTRLQLIRAIEPITVAAYKTVEEKKWREQLDDSPHGNPWHVSFHASQFPGEEMSCPRAALYQMMDFPSAEPTSRFLRTLASAGKAIETDLVKTWDEAGILISAPPDSKFQTGFEVPDAWFTGSVDAVIDPGWNKPVPVEIKTKYNDVIEEMRLGKRGPDENHVKQIKAQLGLVRMFQDDIWPGMDPVTHGYIYYLSRDNPSVTAEFRVDYDPRFFEMGLERLREYKKLFQDDILPEVNPSKKHPMGWKWSYPPCQYCPFKKVCKLDFEDGNQQLSNSIGVARAKLVRPEYNPDKARKRVFERWEKKEK